MDELERDQGRDDVTEAFDDVVRLMIRHLADHGSLTFTAIMCLGRLYRDGPTRLTELAAVEGTTDQPRGYNEQNRHQQRGRGVEHRPGRQ